MTSIDFTSRTAVITGAGRGLGRAYAFDLARRGARLIVTDLPATGQEPSPADAVADEIRGLGGRVQTSYADITTPQGAAEIVSVALEQFGRIDVAINNAGYLRPGRFPDLSDADYDAMLDVHLKGTINVCRAAFEPMAAAGYGRIVNTCSNAGAFGMPAMANYAAAKSALIGFTRTLAAEGAAVGIRANCVLPNAETTISKNTPIPGDQAAQGGTRMYKAQLADRFHPDTVAPLVTFLASEECEVSGELYSALAGRFARVFIGVTDGWGGVSEDPSTAEDVAQHLDEIRDLSRYEVPVSVVDEYRIVAERLALR
ncbi:MAG TPA: SDR family NAD(P)-dependent oxidoreductase [Solirubrobacteraceae bacterium]|nr:SDR family NAD(P)-dependent oxidoreductase [Solirubrobacteraceae bacterium]